MQDPERGVPRVRDTALVKLVYAVRVSSEEVAAA